MAKKGEGGFVIPGLDQDTTFTVIGAGILIAGLGAITLVRRSRARKLSGNTQTQI
jgi:LPXTG-motif cell wall-anchored protein